MNYRALTLQALGAVLIVSTSAPLLAETIAAPDNVRIEADRLLWDPVEGAGGYNIYQDFDYLTTVKNATEFQLQVDGVYAVITFDESASQFSRSSERVTYESGSAPSVSDDLGSRVRVVSITCKDVGPGETCSVGCGGQGQFNLATGGACATSDIVEADATAGPTSYSCSVPTFSGEVTAQVYCLSSRAFQ